MSQFNTTGNKFYETVNFDRGSQAKGLLLPTESGKADLGSPTKKYDNLYVNNIPGRPKEITYGTWNPTIEWSTKGDSFIRPTFPIPTVTVIEAAYQKTGKEVDAFYLFRVDKGGSMSRGVYGFIKNIPFSFYQRVSFMNNVKRTVSQGSPINIYNYASHGSNPAGYWDRDYRGTIGYSLVKRAIGFVISQVGNNLSSMLTYDADSSTRYYYGSFSYRTQN